MTITVVAQVASPVGQGCQWDRAGDPDPFNLPAAGFRQGQPKSIPVHFDHESDWILGHVVHLERSAVDGLLAVAVLDADIADLLSDGKWYVSPRVHTRATGVMQLGDTVISELSLTRTPALINTRPVAWSRTDIRTDGGSQPHNLNLRWRDTWRRAHLLSTSYTYQRRRTEHVILDVEALDPPTPAPVPKTRAEVSRTGTTTFRRGDAMSTVRMDGVALTNDQADVALKVLFNLEIATDGSLVSSV